MKVDSRVSSLVNIMNTLLDLKSFLRKIDENLSRSIVPSSIDNSEINRVEQSCVFFTTSPSELSKIIRSLKNKKSVGHDGLNSEIVKISLPVVVLYYFAVVIRVASMQTECL